MKTTLIITLLFATIGVFSQTEEETIYWLKNYGADLANLNKGDYNQSITFGSREFTILVNNEYGKGTMVVSYDDLKNIYLEDITKRIFKSSADFRNNVVCYVELVSSSKKFIYHNVGSNGAVDTEEFGHFFLIPKQRKMQNVWAMP